MAVAPPWRRATWGKFVMPETPKPIRVLLLAVAVVVLLAAGAVVGVIVVQITQTGDISRPTVAQTPEQPQPGTSPDEAAAEAPTQRTARQRPQPRTVKTPGPAPQPIASPEAPAATRDEPTISLLGTGRSLIVTSGDESKMRIEISPGMVHGKSADVSMLRAARLVKTLDLGEAQKAAVAQFDEMFRTNITQRIEHDEQAVKDVARGLEDALKSGDKQRISVAQEQAMEIAKYQAKATDQLNAQYADGVRQYLSTAQEAQLDKALERTIPTVTGYMTVQRDDGTTDVRILQPNVMVQPGRDDDQ